MRVIFSPPPPPPYVSVRSSRVFRRRYVTARNRSGPRKSRRLPPPISPSSSPVGSAVFSPSGPRTDRGTAVGPQPERHAAATARGADAHESGHKRRGRRMMFMVSTVYTTAQYRNNIVVRVPRVALYRRCLPRVQCKIILRYYRAAFVNLRRFWDANCVVYISIAPVQKRFIKRVYIDCAVRYSDVKMCTRQLRRSMKF